MSENALLDSASNEAGEKQSKAELFRFACLCGLRGADAGFQPGNAQCSGYEDRGKGVKRIVIA